MSKPLTLSGSLLFLASAAAQALPVPVMKQC